MPLVSVILEKVLHKASKSSDWLFIHFCSYFITIQTIAVAVRINIIFNSLSPASRWQRHRGMQGVQPPTVYPRGQSVQKNTMFQRKMNELCENASFDSEFALAFEIQQFKVAFFVFFKCQFFQGIRGLNRLKLEN